ncbi:LIM and calponin homology domains-containing protein 1 isoform X8 [Pimephales promelas]|uniref:LIM and calponin homology domains-containing protein 1 isoform X8 n=1 Tax=Pimephales promelas TaxID=90988 RepID=UPI001955DE8C|nr:LIM and calponin homology domains-containing protein 1 isoform X8 [Pimephales promelas]
MASRGSDEGRHHPLQDHHHHHHHHHHTEPAVREAQRWIEAVTGRSFSDRDFRAGLNNGILLCELLSSIRPGLVKKINRLPTPVAALDNVALFLKGCEELGLKGSQLFDPEDLQDTTHTNKAPENHQKLKHVLITVYWLGRAANTSATYNGPTLALQEFESLMRRELDSPQRSVRDSGYIDCCESERSHSLSPPTHTRDDSFDSLDSIGSRSRHTPSPDGLLGLGYSDGRGSDSESDAPQRKMPDVRKDDMLVRRTSVSEPRIALPFNQYLPNKTNQSTFMPAPVRRPRADRDDSCRSWSSTTSPVGGERPFRFSRSSSVFDDPESVSMIDMRGSEEDSMLPPHSQVRHELMHNQYNMLKEEEDHWQDDLAKWKSRRRSVSQDLIKKEEERKMMERLLSGGGGSQRRKSIKTYREIVEEKERREQELHEAYRSARTPEEAASVLQRYALRFTISEAVLERLKLPKLLERSVSADPTRPSSFPVSSDISCSFSAGSNPLQYLRQQSLPAAKFISSVEAQVTGYSTEPETETGYSTDPVMEAGYSTEQGNVRDMECVSGPSRSCATAPSLAPRPYRQSRSSTAKNEMVRVNGEREDDEQKGGRNREREGCLHTDLTDPDVSAGSTHTPERCENHREHTQTEGAAVPQVSDDDATSTEVLEMKPDDTATDDEQTDETCVSDSLQTVIQADSSAQINELVTEIPQNLSETSTAESCRTRTDLTEKAGNVLNLVKRGEHFSWSPEEERKRQESWQREQERMLQEKYRREQEKLKQEWEQAQKEVEEEERRYHEEERKILEETVTPLTLLSPLNPVTPHSPTALPVLPKTQNTLQSQPEREHRLGPVENQTSSEDCRQRENGVGEATQTHTQSLQMTVSSSPQPGCVSVGPRGRGEPLQSPQDTPLGNREQNETCNKNTSQPKPGGRKRSDSVENIGPHPSSSPSFTDTQTPPSPNRSVSGKKLCSSCGHPLGKGAAMIIETLSLYFHIQCFKCGICKGQLGDTSTGTDVRIRNGLLNCHQCYIRSRSAGQPTTL